MIYNAAMPGRSSPKRRTNRADLSPEPIAAVLLRASGEPRDGAPLPPRAWHDAVGDRIARRARPMKLERGVLTVRAATAVWAQELTFVAPTIVARLCALGFAVEALRFRVGPIDPAERPLRPPSVKTVPAREALPAAVLEQLARVSDDALRETLSRAAAANLAWQAAARPQARAGARATSVKRDAQAPRSAGAESAPSDRTPKIDRAGRPGRP
jgi:hypothetical protein